MPDERFRAVMHAEAFLQALCNATDTPRIPKSIRQQARGILRHYPNFWDMQAAAEGTPTHFQEKMEPLNRMIKKYEAGKNNAT
jgi:hypothetical protein